MTLTIKRDLDSVKYVGNMSLHTKLLSGHTQTRGTNCSTWTTNLVAMQILQ